MTKYNIINDLTKGKFYSGGKIYIKLNPEDPAKREEIFEKIKQIKNKNCVSKINFYETQETENQFKSKLMNDFLDLSQNQNPASVENIEADASKFVDKLLPDDLIKLDHIERISHHIKNCEFRILEGEDHSSYIIHNKKIAKIILEELK